MAKIREEVRKKIKDKEIVVDEKAGTATITVTLSPKRLEELAIKLNSGAAKILVEETGIEVDGLIKADTINNKRREVSGQWVFRIKGKQQTPKKEPVKREESVEKKAPVKKDKPVKKETVVKEEPKKEQPKAEAKKEEPKDKK